MGESERAVYELLEHGPISAAKSVLFAGTLNALVAARLARRTQDGGYELVTRRDDTEVLTVELPADCIALLDFRGPTREAALNALLRQLAGSGVWRKR